MDNKVATGGLDINVRRHTNITLTPKLTVIFTQHRRAKCVYFSVLKRGKGVVGWELEARSSFMFNEKKELY
jgi:hypothetical protein